MNWYKIFYWLTVADNAKTFFVVFIVVFTAVTAISTVSYFIFSGADGGQDKSDKDNQRMSRKWIWYSTPFTILFWALYIFTPSKTDSLIIITGGVIGNFLTTDSSSAKIPADLTRYLHLSFQKEISDLDPETKKQLGLSTPKENFTDKLKDMTKEQIIDYLKTDTTLTIK